MLPKLSQSARIIQNPEQFLQDLGEIHDADLESFEWKAGTRNLIIEIDDLYSNFFQTIEYPGRMSARFIANGVQNLKIDIVTQKAGVLRLLRFQIVQCIEKRTIAALIFGEGRIEFEFHQLTGMSR
jgi:hypothetical protein